MKREAENQALMHENGGKGPGFTITRGADAVSHTGKRQRGADTPGFALHPAILRGMQQFRETADCGGATAKTLFSMSGLHISYVWFQSHYPLPLHSHDVDCYYLVIGGAMKVGSEILEPGDGVLIPAGAPYTVDPAEGGVEFLEMRTSADYDTHYRAKTDTYWDRVANTRRERKDIWAKEPPPLDLLGLRG